MRGCNRIVTRLLLAGGLAGIGAAAAGAAEGGTTERVSVGPGGVEARTLSGSYEPAISGDGRFVAFTSLGDNLVGQPTYRFGDVFVRDRRTGLTELVSVGLGGAAADDDSSDSSISRGGRFVAFTSRAKNLVPGGMAGGVFVRDRQTGRTERVGAGFRPAISADGRFVAFLSYAEDLVPGDTNGYLDVFVHDRRTGRTELVSVGTGGTQGDADSGGDVDGPSISADGRFVAFTSQATNLVPGDTNIAYDVFVRDRQRGTTERVSVRTDGGLARGGRESVEAAISANGRVVAFQSDATNLVPRDRNGDEDIFVRVRPR